MSSPTCACAAMTSSSSLSPSTCSCPSLDRLASRDRFRSRPSPRSPAFWPRPAAAATTAASTPKFTSSSVLSGKDIVVEYKKLLTLGGQNEYTIHPGDVIYVPVSGFNKAASVFRKVGSAATLISIAAVSGVRLSSIKAIFSRLEN